MDRSYAKAVDPYMPTSTSGKHRLTQVDPELGAQKRQRRTGNLAGEVPQTSKSFPKVDTQATSPDTGIGPYDDVALEASPRETGDSLARQVTQGGGQISTGAIDALKHEVQLLRESVARIECSFEVVQNRLMTLERLQPRIEGQLDILVRMQQPVVRSPFLAQAPSSLRGKALDKA